jgi:tape measure domain-containing protein
MDKLMTIMGRLDGTSEKVLNPNTFSRASSQIDKSATSSKKLEASLNGVQSGATGASSNLGHVAEEADSAKRSIQGTVTETGNLSNRLSALGHGAQVLQTITDLASRARGVLSNMGLDVFNFEKALKREDAASNFSKVMQRTYNSAEVAKDATADVLEIVNGTAYGLDNSTMAVKQLVNAGMGLKPAIETVRSWGDAVAGMGYGTNESFDRVMLNLSQMVTSGKADGQDMMSILEQGIPIYKMYADAVGKSVAEVKNDLSSGKINVEDFINTMTKAFDEGTNSFASVKGAAKSAGDLWENTFSNASAAIARGQQSLMKGLDGAVAGALGEGKSLKSIFADSGSFIEQKLKDIGAFAQEYGPSVGKFFATIGGGLAYINENSGVIKVLTGGLGGLLILSTINKLFTLTVTKLGLAKVAVLETIAPVKKATTNMIAYGNSIKIAAMEGWKLGGSQKALSAVVAGGKVALNGASGAAEKFGTALKGIGKATLWMAALEAGFWLFEKIQESMTATERAHESMANAIETTYGSSITEAYESAYIAAAKSTDQMARLDAQKKGTKSASTDAAAGTTILADANKGLQAEAAKANREIAIQKGLLKDSGPVDTYMKGLTGDTEMAKSLDKVRGLYQELGIDVGKIVQSSYEHAVDPKKVGPDIDSLRKKMAEEIANNPEKYYDLDNSGMLASDKRILDKSYAVGQASGDEFKNAMKESMLSGEGPLSAVLDKAMLPITGASSQFQGAIDKMKSNDALGIDVDTSGVEGANTATQKYNTTLEKTIEDIKAIQALNDPFMNLQNAKSNWEQAKDDVLDPKAKGKSTKGGKVNLGTEGGRELNDKLQTKISAAEDVIKAMNEEGKTYVQQKEAADKMYSDIAKFANENKLSDKELANYVKPEELLPPAIKIDADTTDADAKINTMKTTLETLGKNPENFIISADGTAAYSEIDKITARLTEGGSIVLAGDTSKLDKQLEGAMTEINGKQGTVKIVADQKKLSTELSTVERKINEATKDRTVDITINEHKTSSTKRAGGGPIQGPGGPRDDKVPVWGSDGEWMSKASTVRKAGGFSGMRKLTRLIDTGALKLANGGGISSKTYSAKSMKTTSPKEYLDQKASREYIRKYQQKFSIPVSIGTINETADVNEVLKKIEDSVKEAAQSSV